MSDKKCRLIKECSFLKWKWFQLLLLQIHSLYLCQTVNFLAEPFRGCKRAPTRLVSFTLSIISIYFFSVESRLNVFENVSHKVICRSFCIVWAEMSLFHIKRLKIMVMVMVSLKRKGSNQSATVAFAVRQLPHDAVYFNKHWMR